MTLMDAQQYDEARDRRRRGLIIVGVIVAMFLAWVGYHERNHSARHTVREFFAALEHKDYERAYGIWFHDPNWKQHPQQYPKYGYGEFFNDWGPPGEWGEIKSYKVDCSLSDASSVIVQATVNGRSQHAFIYYDKSDKTLHDSPSEIDCGNWYGWLTE
ncbi:MAG TPA: hypothetical protein VF133_18405 [Terriglobales bacterium]